MIKNELVLCQCVPIHLNLLLFIRNIYKNISEKTSFFPHYQSNNRGLLEVDQFNINFQEICNDYLENLQTTINVKSILLTDIQMGGSIEKLFTPNDDGRNAKQTITCMFFNWWYADSYGGNTLLETAGDNCIQTIWKNKLINLSNIKNSTAYTIICVFEQFEIELEASHFHVEPLHSLFPSLDIEGISTRISRNLNK